MRKLTTRGADVFEDIVKDSILHVGIRKLDENRIALLARLILSGISRYFFFNPDDSINLGFLKFEKSPNKDEMFHVRIVRSENDGVVNADTMWRYYKGDLMKEAELKGVLDDFITELLNYSQVQEVKIAQLAGKISTEKRKEK